MNYSERTADIASMLEADGYTWRSRSWTTASR